MFLKVLGVTVGVVLSSIFGVLLSMAGYGYATETVTAHRNFGGILIPYTYQHSSAGIYAVAAVCGLGFLAFALGSAVIAALIFDAEIK